MSQTDHKRVQRVGKRYHELKLRGKGLWVPGVMKALTELRREEAFWMNNAKDSSYNHG